MWMGFSCRQVNRLRRPACAVAMWAVLTVCASPSQGADLDFNRDVRPILSENCFACHGFDDKAREADLRLDIAEGAFADRDGVVPIKPGHPEESAVWKRITSDDEFEQMPPPDSNLKLTDEQKATIRRWIEEGAQYADHWSFLPPKKSQLPDVPAEWGAVNAVDRFVQDRLQEEGLSPSADADRYTLIRRLSFDLTGLPPSAAEVEEFANSKTPDAYASLVDRLLESPHFGERMALEWLDAARYADTNGFSIDGGRHMWLWRDWVIQAFNDNKPYDEFLLEQIAGDLLPDPTPGQLIATGFQRNNMVTHEGGTIPEENLTTYNADRVKTLGEAVLGLTLGCAQCHDHKYDPITQRDYYSLFAYFNTLSDVGLDGNAGVNPRPYVQARTVLRTGEEADLRERIERLREGLANPSPEAILEWEEEQRSQLALRGDGLELVPLDVLKISTPNRGAGFEIEPPRTVRITQPSGLAAYDVLAELPQLDQPMTGLRVVFHAGENTPGKGLGYGPRARRGEAPETGTFRLTALSVSAGEVPADQVDLYGLIGAKQVTASSWDPDHEPANVLDMRNENGWMPEDNATGPVRLTYTFDAPISTASNRYLTTQLNFGGGQNLIAAEWQLFAMVGRDDDSSLPADVIEILETERNGRTEAQQERLRGYYISHAPAMHRLRIDLANAEERLAVLTEEFSTMVMNVAEKPRQTFILNRGDYSQPTVPVSMETPEFLPDAEGPQENRLALARWITMPDHPLTARVYVNRVWQLLFGTGIVATAADFGSQGEWPTHPELLDWLAVDFVEHGWDVKRLIRQIVLSKTYRQSSAVSPELLERDPQNRLLARGPRFRLPAEFIRDAALKISGLLVDDLGGPSVNPYTPGDLWREISHYGSTPATAQTFVQDHGEKLYRRSMYTYWKRTAPPPNMAAFDAPNRETCVVSRPTTNTPLQALVLLNDVQFVEAARAFAERIVKHDETDEERLKWAVLTALSRPATERELAILTDTLARERDRYAADVDAAEAIVRVGESPRDQTISVSEHASWTQIASLLLNVSEAVTRR